MFFILLVLLTFVQIYSFNYEVTDINTFLNTSLINLANYSYSNIDDWCKNNNELNNVLLEFIHLININNIEIELNLELIDNNLHYITFIYLNKKCNKYDLQINSFNDVFILLYYLYSANDVYYDINYYDIDLIQYLHIIDCLSM